MDILKVKLYGMLQKFYAELLKENGQEYEPGSLNMVIVSLKNCVNYSILIDKDFELSKALKGKAIKLQQIGKRKRPRKANSVISEGDVLCETVLSKMNPVRLNYTMFF